MSHLVSTCHNMLILVFYRSYMDPIFFSKSLFASHFKLHIKSTLSSYPLSLSSPYSSASSNSKVSRSKILSSISSLLFISFCSRSHLFFHFLWAKPAIWCLRLLFVKLPSFLDRWHSWFNWDLNKKNYGKMMIFNIVIYCLYMKIKLHHKFVRNLSFRGFKNFDVY